VDVSIASVDRLCTLFGKPGQPSPILLLGAGASVKSGIPLSGELVERAARWEYCNTHNRHFDDPSVVRTDWMRWLQAHKWYDANKPPEDNYSQVIENLLVPKQNRKDFFLRILNPDVPASVGYERLLSLLDAGFVKTVLTTNFDHVLPDLRTSRRRPHHIELIRTPADYDTFSTSPTYPQYVYLHGSVEHYRDKNLIEEVQQLDPQLISLLLPVLRDHPLVVVGYRGAEPSVMTHLLASNSSSLASFRQGVYWCCLDPEKITSLAVEFAKCIRPNFLIVPILGFDQLMQQIYEHCEAQPALDHSTSKPRTPDQSQLPFDMRSVSDISLDELDWISVESHLLEYSQRMHLPLSSRSRSELAEQLVNLDLLRRVNGELKPTVAGALLFLPNPELKFTAVETSIVIDGKTTTLKGNLWVQATTLFEIFDELNRPFIVKTQQSEVVFPYPKLALRELPINAFVHRDYEANSPAVIEVEANCLRISNPGGLVDEMVRRVKDSLQSQIESGIRGLKGYRNPVIADLFCGTGMMEKLGSGLPDVHQSVTKNGGRVFFGPIEDNNRFRAIVYARAEEIDRVTKTAIPATNRSRYSTNLLEIQARPSWMFYLKDEAATVDSDRSDVLNRALRPFLRRKDGTIITFVDPHASGISSDSGNLIASVDVQASPVLTTQRRRDLVGMYNLCLYEHLENSGMIVDYARKRAYFPRTDSGPKEVRYQASVRQATRTVTKPFVSRASQRVLYWEHEAIWFGFEYYKGTYALRILPGYVFTVDGQETLLHHRRVGALATRKAARDFNLQVFNDLVFWSWMLSGGQKEIVLKTGASPIVISSTLASCELEIPAEADIQFVPPESKWSDDDVESLEQEIAEEKEAELDEEQGR
jgi:Putative ATP-dependent DNA helicase recG C-terminal/SIR2-like domain